MIHEAPVARGHEHYRTASVNRPNSQSLEGAVPRRVIHTDMIPSVEIRRLGELAQAGHLIVSHFSSRVNTATFNRVALEGCPTRVQEQADFQRTDPMRPHPVVAPERHREMGREGRGGRNSGPLPRLRSVRRWRRGRHLRASGQKDRYEKEEMTHGGGVAEARRFSRFNESAACSRSVCRSAPWTGRELTPGALGQTCRAQS